MSDFALSEAQSMALNFPAWLSRQPEPVRSRWEKHLGAVKDRPAEERRLTNTFWFSAQTDRSVAEVNDNYDVFRASMGAQLHWGDDWKDDGKIFSRIHEEATRTQSLEKVLTPSAGTDEATQTANKKTMLYWADEAARKGQDSATAFQEWQALPETQTSVGYQHAQQSGEGLYTPFHEWYLESDRQWREREAKADAVIGAVTKEMNNDSPVFLGFDAAKLLEDRPAEEQERMLQLVIQRSVLPEKGGWQQAGEAVGRPFAKLLEENADKFGKLARLALKFKEGYTLRLPDEEYKKIKEATPEEQGRLAEQYAEGDMLVALVPRAEGGAGPNMGLAKLFWNKFTLSAEAAEAANAEVTRRKKNGLLLSRLREIARNDIDPVAGWSRDMPGTGWFAQHVTYPALSLFGTALTFQMPGGWVLNTTAAANAEENRLLAMNVDEGTAALQGGLSGAIQTMLFGFGPRMLAKVPGFKWLAGRVAPPPSGFAGAVGQRLVTLPGQLTVATGFNTAAGVTPLVLQNIFSRFVKEEPSIPWSEIRKEAWTVAGESFFGLMPILFMGHGIGGYRDYRNVGRTLRDPDGLRLLGFSEEQRQRIFNAGSERAMFQVLREEWPHRTPILTAAASPYEAHLDEGIQSGNGVRAMTAARFKAELETARQFHTRMQEFLREDAGSPDILRTAAGWEVRRSDGKTLTLQSPAEVQLALISFGRAKARADAARIHREVEKIVRRDQAAGIDSEHTLRTEEQRFRREGDTVRVFTRRGGQEHPLEISAAALARLREEMNALGLDEGTIRGANYTLIDDTGRLIRRYETNTGADVSTILHERVETLYKAGLASPPDVRAAAAHLAALPRFDPAKIKDPGQRRMAEFIRRIAGEDPTLTDAGRREALVELLVADGEGRFRDGTPLEPRSFLTSVRHAAMSAGGRVRNALVSLLEYMGLVRRQHDGMHELVRAFNRARETGEIKPGDAWDVFAQKLRDAEDSTAARTEILSPNRERARVERDTSFSLRPASEKTPGLSRNWPDVWKDFPPIQFLTDTKYVTSFGGEQIRVPEFDHPVNKDWYIAKGYGQYTYRQREQAATDLITRINDHVAKTDPGRIRALLKWVKEHPSAELVPVRSLENPDKAANQLPEQFARRIAGKTGNPVHDRIEKNNTDRNTKKDAFGRLVTPHFFAGEVIPGKEYILVDDVSTLGSTALYLARYIESQGGKVIGVVQMGVTPRGRGPTGTKIFVGDEATLTMSQNTRNSLLRLAGDAKLRHGDANDYLNSMVQKLGIAHDWRELTDGLGRALASHWEKASQAADRSAAGSGAARLPSFRQTGH